VVFDLSGDTLEGCELPFPDHEGLLRGTWCSPGGSLVPVGRLEAEGRVAGLVPRENHHLVAHLLEDLQFLGDQPGARLLSGYMVARDRPLFIFFFRVAWAAARRATGSLKGEPLT